MSKRFQEDGLPSEASVEERQRHLWQQLLSSEATLRSATQELQALRILQAGEMKEVRHFTGVPVDHLLPPHIQIFVLHGSEERLGQLNRTAAHFGSGIYILYTI